MEMALDAEELHDVRRRLLREADALTSLPPVCGVPTPAAGAAEHRAGLLAGRVAAELSALAAAVARLVADVEEQDTEAARLLRRRGDPA